ncbi:hypothetical protein MOD07_10670 [Bacillus mojavensis]|uniref:Uncharacterized protein n=1 Tax=Bacillus mojavensis TaxID=72360 RepID=A0AAP3CRY7_BACMO|nr:FAD-binding domain-containing protein [Bacillus mojavensis]MCY8103746.1 hypothetical protein [Bacillus mojavensis]MCY8481086.1 hypothetical protein [Bacillus mojavensis]MCY8510014.1 hypothetical protein [Bacillus mojavensis]MEC1774635.1 FAD-binding domain-containing protein [Bacillus mojavensis]
MKVQQIGGADSNVCKGRIGCLLTGAGMRQAEQGGMLNKLRMMMASFLVRMYGLLGEKLF